MLARYHDAITRAAIGLHFSAEAYDTLIRANWSQDAVPGLFDEVRHYTGDTREKAPAYIDEEFARIAELAPQPDRVTELRQAFGRITHTTQDFYAHTNYVDLWLAASGGLDNTTPDQIDGLDDSLRHSPDLILCTFVNWRDWLYYVPLIGDLFRRIYLDPQSHEAMHLDMPSRGPKYHYAAEAARQRTVVEYNRACDLIREHGGHDALTRFHGQATTQPEETSP